MDVSVQARCHVDAYLRGDLSEKFYGVFRPREESPSKKKNDKKKGKKKTKSKEKIRKQKRDKSPEAKDSKAAAFEIHSNASAFNVYSTVRQAVLDQSMRDASRVYQLASGGVHSDSDSEDEGEDKSKEGIIKIPKIVGLGLNGVFELIRETENRYPELCIKALSALMDMLQGQQPEAMKSEPFDVIEKLYELLLDLATAAVPAENRQGQELTALACSSLLSLVIALGDTGKILNAIQSLLRGPPTLKTQEIKVPSIVTHLQRSIQAVLIGRSQLPEWFSQGVREKARCEKFSVDITAEDDVSGESSAIASDGKYLYIMVKNALYKIGTGYGGTIKGHLYGQKETSGNKKVWLAFAGGKLFSKSENNSTVNLCVINRESMEVEDMLVLDSNHTTGPSILFSDGDNIGQIAPAKDQDNFVVRTYSPTESPLPLQHEVPLKLTRKCMDVVGTSAIDGETGRHSVATGFDEDAVTIFAGKEFGLIRTVGGKVLYTGKPSALGIKQGGPAPGKWVELPITKSPKILQMAVGHEGQHALLVAEDGSVFFVGLSRRGEDGDSSMSKARRQPKAVKPKKMIRMEGKNVVWGACNMGSSALVSKEGEVFIFGKDTTYCDHTSGQVTDLKEVVVTHVVLGKAHAVALTIKGRIYTFGINNKGQCGREFNPATGREASNNVTMVEEEEEAEADDTICPTGKHRWKQYQCMLCTVCGECTGYGSSCVNSSRENRNVGQPCGCGAGDSGCSECGICRVCAGEKLDVDELDDRGLLGVVGGKKDVIPLDVLLSGRQGRQEYLARRLEQRVEKGEVKMKQKLAKEKRNRAAAEGTNELDTDYTKSVTLPPAEVIVGNGNIPVTQVACGLHHTVVLLQNGDVYTFGSNSSGQLGLGDTTVRGAPTKVPLPLAAIQVAAGSHHTVILLTSGQVYTCGDYQKGALGREGPEEMVVKSKKAPWCSTPGPVPGVGARLGRRATWVGANGDQTFMRIDESLINAHTLARSNIFASQSCIGLIPKGGDSAAIMKCLMISKHDGNCKSFREGDQEDLRDYSVCLDPVYDVLWGFSLKNGEMRCYNVMKAESGSFPSPERGYCHILSPELAVPAKPNCLTSRSHCALHILGCLDTLTLAQQLNLTVAEELQERSVSTKVYTKEDYSIVNRFESHGGGWGYSGHSVEAVRFMCDTDILLGGFGLFGGRGEYFGRIKLYELGVEGGENETDGELLTETEEVAFECAPREKFAMLFEEPVPLQANCWYVALARISGPSSDCGSGGQAVVTTDDQVIFKFKSSKKSNNGTDVNAGQIPQLLYRLPSRDSHCVIRRNDHSEPAHILSPDFALSVTPQCFEALLQLLEWGWNSFHSSINDMDGLKGVHQEAAVADLRRLVYICCSCLRLMKIYVSQVYPDGVSKKKGQTENSEMVQCIGDMRELLKRILAEEVTPASFRVFLSDPTSSSEFADLREEVLQECHEAYCACFHAFYPTTTLKWWCLCELLSQIEPGAPNVTGIGRLLAAVMQALCHPTVWLTNILPINLEPETVEVLRRHSFCMDDNTNSAARLGEYHRYPLLASHMSYRMEIDSMGSSHISFREVLDRLLMIVALPVRQALNDDPAIFPTALVINTCALLTTIISELGSSATGLEIDMNTASRPLLVTPNRFYRTSQSAFWNTGNGSPDAICFSVDRPGIVIAGICAYGGGGTYEYEVELLDEAQTEVQGELSHTQRFNTLETVKGVFTFEDCVNDIMEIKFDHPIPIKEGVRYAVKLRNHGPRTLNGDGGLSKVKCPDGTTFTFSACPLSSNGTNHMRGQIPQILYYSSPQEGESQHHSIRNLAELQARKNALDIASAIVRMATDLLHRAQSLDIEEVGEILGQSSLFATLLPLSLAYIGPVAAQDPRGAVQVLYLIQEILPAVVALTKQMVPSTNLHGSVGSDATSTTATTATTIADSCTTSPHYAMVESDHPYKQAAVSRYKVEFPSSVQWMALEFDPQCATAQVEDSLQLFVPSRHAPAALKGKATADDNFHLCYWPILKRFHGNTFPKQALILPGHEVVFSLETASDYLRDEKQSFYGFKCTIIGYEWSSRPEETVVHLEKELSYLGGQCAASLMKKDINLPQVTMEELDDEMDLIEEHAQLVYHAHASLLGKGFALSHPPSIIQALEGNLPFCWQSNERAFLKDYVLCTAGTSGGRLARWLQPDSYLDPKQCEVICNTEDLKCCWPAVITIITRDQYGNMVNVPDLKVEVNAVPVDQKDNVGEDYKRLRRMSRPDEGDLNFGGHAIPNLDTAYEPTMKDRKDVYHSITMMKVYENYSFEELRFAAPAVPRPSENMLVRANNDGTYSANWTPSCVGCYSIHVSVDGYQAGELSKVEVKEPPQGMPPPAQAVKKSHQPSRLRRFVQSNSAGLRVRVHPTLQSEQIGVIKPEGIISFVDEVHNDDGVWLRLGVESAKEWGCDDYNEAWCLQYNQHLGKTLLVPVEEPKTMEEMGKETSGRKTPVRRVQKKQSKGPGVYQVVKCGAFGHNIRSRPNLKGTAVGMLTRGDKVTVLEDAVNVEGIWVRLDPESSEQYLKSNSTDTHWSLAVGHDGIEYLLHESDFGQLDKDPFTFNSLPPASQRGFNFAASSAQYGATFPSFKPKDGVTRAKSLPYTGFAFGLPMGTASVPSFGQNYGEASGSQFGAAFGSGSDISEDRDTNQSQSWEESPFIPTVIPPRPPPSSEASGKEGEGVAHSRPDLPPELQGASVKELVRALGESRANANGPTPQPSPPGSPKTRSPKRSSRSASPLPAAEAASPEAARRGSFSKDETFKTPPASPLPSRSSRGRLKKEPSFERSASTPPATPPPLRKEYMRGVSEGAGPPPSAPGSASPGPQRYGSPGRGAR